MSFMLRRAPMAINPRAKPPKPAEIQVLPCPPGTIGPGITQTRVCTFDYGLAFNWVCTDWQTVISNCQPAAIQFVTPDEHFVPPLSGHGGEPGDEQTYGPYTVPNSGYNMTLTYKVYITGDGDPEPDTRLSDLTITLDPVPVGTLEVYWNRDYATFPNKSVDPSGTTQWLRVPNDEWTANSTQFTITLYIST